MGTCEYGEEPSGSKNAGNFLTAEPVSFSRRTLLHGVSKCLDYPVGTVGIYVGLKCLRHETYHSPPYNPEAKFV